MAVWIALAVFLLCLAVGLALAVTKGARAWRAVKQTKASFGSGLDRISDATAGISAQLDRAQESQERLAAAQARLAESRARLRVQLGAVREARRAVDRMLWFLPGR